MNAKKCDRCGGYFHKNIVRGLVLGKIGFAFRTINIDLCKQCSDDLQKWFENTEIQESEGNSDEN